MDVDEIYEERRRRFALLLNNYRNQAEAADALGFGGPAPVSNLKRGHDNMGEDVARRVEKLGKLRAGTLLTPFQIPWEDENKTSQRNGASSNVGKLASSEAVGNASKASQFTDVKIETYESWMSEGPAREWRMSVPLSWLQSQGYDSSQIKSFTMPDNSQSDLVLKDYEVAVNVNWGDKLQNDKFYAINIGGLVTLRKVEYRASGGIHLRCLNPDYSDESLTAEEVDNLDIVGVAVRFQGSFPD